MQSLETWTETDLLSWERASFSKGFWIPTGLKSQGLRFSFPLNVSNTTTCQHQGLGFQLENGALIALHQELHMMLPAPDPTLNPHKRSLKALLHNPVIWKYWDSSFQCFCGLRLLSVANGLWWRQLSSTTNTRCTDRTNQLVLNLNWHWDLGWCRCDLELDSGVRTPRLQG